VERTANIGILPKELALSHGCSGPMLRGSLNREQGDPEWDLRRIEPYCGYETYNFDVIIPPFPEAPPEAVIGDNWHRFYVRMREVIESIKIVRQGLDRYPNARGSHRIELPRHLPQGEAYMETECPRGQMGFYVVGRATKDIVRSEEHTSELQSLAYLVCRLLLEKKNKNINELPL